MKKVNGGWGRGFILCVLIALISISMVGSVSAADPQPTDTHGHPIPLSQGTGTGTSGATNSESDMMETCELMMGNTSMMSGPVISSAGTQMMESVEVSAMGQPMHDEMQGLVTMMMAGNLSSADQARMVEMMNKYPGASNMMMTRMMGSYVPGTGGYPGTVGTGGECSGTGMMGGAGMMSMGFLSGGIILGALFFVVWLVVGILLIIWLVRQLRKNKIQP